MHNLLFIDNYDSFTYNLVAYCQELGANTKVVHNDEVTLDEIKSMNPDKILISPGPGSPSDAGISLKVIANFHQTIPILGVCLGHQCIAQYFGADIVQAKRLMHGKTSEIIHDNSQIFKNVKNNFIATRYHSLIISNNDLPNNLLITAYTEFNNTKEIMAIEHKKFPIYGVQFHPEAVLSEFGHNLLNNFLEV